MGKFIDMTGWIMKEHGVPESRLTVISRTQNQGKHICWLCKCECGTEIVIRGDQLRSGIAKSCGCLQKEIAKRNCAITGKSNKNKVSSQRQNLIGQIFGLLQVIDYYDTFNSKAYWKCKCQCGHEIIVSGTHLMSGHTKSCGCNSFNMISNAKIIDLIGKTRGKLTVIEYLGIENHLAQWRCQCSCGNKTIVNSYYFTHNIYPNCGCVHSLGENKIVKILEQLNINYKREYSFTDLKDKKPLRFDFAIFNQNNDLIALIEYQGQQHYQPILNWKSPIIHDNMKREYCLQHNIKLFEISYQDYDKINNEYIKELLKCLDI